MKILNIGLDNSILKAGSALQARAKDYSALVNEYFVLVPNNEYKEVNLPDNSRAVGVKAGNKICGLYNIYKKAKEIVIKKNIDVISVQDQYYLALVGLWLTKKFKIGLEIQIHGFEKFVGLRKKIAHYVIPRANAIRVVSERMKKRIIDDFDVEEEKITVVPIFGELPSLNFDFSKNKTENARVILLTVGRLVPVKNIKMQIEALAELGDYFELRIVGDGEGRIVLENLVKKLKLEDRVKFIGWQKDLSKYYSEADIFLLTSNSEGWGLVVVEAIHYGLPVIMTDVGLAGEIIKNGESGIVIPVGDVLKLKSSIVELFKNRELREKIRKGAYEAIKKLPTKEETLKLYKISWRKAMQK